MCEPTLIVGIIGLVMSASAQKQQGDYQKGTDEYNARVAENEAEESRSIGIEQENIQRQRTAQLLSKQRAQLGAANIELTSGSALQLQQDTVTLGEADALRIRSGTASRIGALGTEADLLRSHGDFAQTAGANQATGTLLSGSAQVLGTGVADKWFTPNSSANTTGGSLGMNTGTAFG